MIILDQNQKTIIVFMNEHSNQEIDQTTDSAQKKLNSLNPIFLAQYMNNRKQLMRVFSSLSPIQEVYSAQSTYLGNKIEYEGLIKRDSGLLAVWSARRFVIRMGDSHKAQLAILKNKDSVEEVLFLNQLKITLKSMIIDDKPCFGIVTNDQKKYLLSVKNVHDCHRFHAQLSQIKKMEKQFLELMNKKSQELSIINSQKDQNEKRSSNQHHETNQQSQEMSQAEESQRINRRYRQKQLGFSSSQSNQNKTFQSNFCEVSTSVAIEDEESIFSSIQKFFDKNQNTLLNTNYGLVPYAGFQKQKILINNDNVAKSTFILMTSATIHSCIHYFLSFSGWNQQVKKKQTLNKTENGSIVYIQFTKGLTAQQSRCVIAQVSILENDYGAAIRIKSVKHPDNEYLSERKQIKMELLAKVVTDRSNKLQKVMTVALSLKPSKEELELAVRFLRAIREFQQKCKKMI